MRNSNVKPLRTCNTGRKECMRGSAPTRIATTSPWSPPSQKHLGATKNRWRKLRTAWRPKKTTWRKCQLASLGRLKRTPTWAALPPAATCQERGRCIEHSRTPPWTRQGWIPDHISASRRWISLRLNNSSRVSKPRLRVGIIIQWWCVI